MTGREDATEELRALVNALIDAVDPVLRQWSSGDLEPSSCSWCPLCALVAVLRGEHHDLVALLATQGSGLLTVAREVVDGGCGCGCGHRDGAEVDEQSSGPASESEPPVQDEAVQDEAVQDAQPAGPTPPQPRHSGFERITVRVEQP